MIDKKADYVLNLKGNHRLLREEVEEYFKDVERDGFRDTKVIYTSTLEKGHGRIEQRAYYYSSDINWMDARNDWPGSKAIGMVIRRCEVNGHTTEERAFYLTSVKTVHELAKGAREHWNIESMHWSLDVTFREDASKTRTKHAPENLAVLKRLALNMVKKDSEGYPKKSLKRRRFLALLNTDYFEYLFDLSFGKESN